MSKETLEEAAKNHSNQTIRDDSEKSFTEGAKWQADRMYTEEDMREAIRFGFDKGFCSNSRHKTKNLGLSEQEWFEQHKKK